MKQRIAALLALLLMQIVPQSAPAGTDAALTSFCYSHSGMSVDQIYTYSVRVGDEGMLADFELYCRVEIEGVALDGEDAESLRALIDECDLWSWNGFAGSNPDILDGGSFSLRVRFDDGTEICAWGSNAWPEGYGMGAQAICAYFDALMEKHGVEAA